MPSYELTVILKALPRSELKVVLKRAAESIMSHGILHRIENLGTRELPYKMKKDSIWHKRGSYYLFYFDSHTADIDDLLDQYQRDVDILKPSFSKVVPPTPVQCTLAEELLPPAYRPEVKKLIEEGRKKEPKRFKMHVDYYPF